MKFSLNWLLEHTSQQYTLNELSAILRAHGFPIEYMQKQLGSKFIIAEIQSYSKHPNADRLNICEVYDGSELHTIVCGATNLSEIKNTILALPGAVLPSGHKIAVSKIRGIESSGMLCSESELGLPVTNNGIINIPISVPLGTLADNILQPDGPELDVEITFNRPDLLSVKGIARELGCKSIISPQKHSTAPLRLIASNLTCFYSIAAVIVPMPSSPTPPKILSRLSVKGSQSHHFPVDLTNYIMHDIGQPMHAFDADKIQGQLTARLSESGESLTLLSGEEFTLEKDVPIFSDNAGPVSIIGVAGGARTACDQDTVRVLFESTYIQSDYFKEHAPNIPTAARHFSFRGLDPQGPFNAINSVLSLCKIDTAFEYLQNLPEPTVIQLDCELIQSALGFVPDFSKLEHFGFKVIDSSVLVPSWRADVTSNHNIVEEFLRLYDPNSIPIIPLHHQLAITKSSQNTRKILASHELHEITTSSLIESSDLFVHASIANSTRKLRSSLLPGLLSICHDQLSRRITQWTGIFEIGICFDPQNPQNESQKLAILLNPEARVSIEKYIDLLQLEVTECNIHAVPAYFNPKNVFAINSTGHYGLLHPQITELQSIYALEVSCPISARPALISNNLSPSQTHRDITIHYTGSIRALHNQLKTLDTPATRIAIIDKYQNAVTFRIFISDSTLDCNAIAERYQSKAAHISI